MRHHDDRSPFDTPFDAAADEARDLTEEFWGVSRGWSDEPRRSHTAESAATVRADDTTGSLRAIRDGFAAFRPRTSGRSTGGVERTRQHGIVRPVADRATDPMSDTLREVSLGELAGGRPATTGFADAWYDDVEDTPSHDAGAGDERPEPDDQHDVPLTPVAPLAERLGLDAVDPLLRRVGAIVLTFVLLVPFARSLRPGEADAVATDEVPAVAPLAAGTPMSTDEPTSTSVAAGSSITAAATAPASTAAATPAGLSEATTAATVADEDASDAASVDAVEARADAPEDTTSPAPDPDAVEAATVDVPADRVEPDCDLTYEARTGDSWYGIAAAAGVSPTALLGENRASADTVILPGDEICLPDGASVPTTIEPTTTTEPPADEPDDPPATTEPPSTTTAPVSATEAKQIIRDVWPDELEDKALEIAYRESHWNPRAYNGWCCYGLFQIYWSVHESWLDEYGIHSAEDLFDAGKNAEAAYAMYRASGGWGPWGG